MKEFHFSEELRQAMDAVSAALERRRGLIALRDARPALHTAAIAARDAAKLRADELAVSVAVAEHDADEKLPALRRALDTAREAVAKGDDAIAGHDAVTAGLTRKVEETDAEIVAAADVLRPLAAAFRDEVQTALADEYLQAVRAFVEKFPRFNALAASLGLPLGPALDRASLSHPTEQRGILSQCRLTEGTAAVDLRSSGSDGRVAVQCTEFAQLGALEQRTAPARGRQAARKQATFEAEQRRGRERAFSNSHPKKSSGNVTRPAPAPAEPQSAPGRSWSTTWRDPAPPGVGAAPSGRPEGGE